MDFDKHKEKSLNWDDKSKKGSVDIQIKPLLDAINKLPNFYTTSSCAGRIDVIALSPTKRKDESNWLYVTHDHADFDDMIKSLENLPESEIWFRMESAIIHVCAKTLDDAITLLNKAKESGFKHSGILSISDRVIVEIFGSEKVDTIIAKDGKLLVDHGYLRTLIDISNIKLDETRNKVERLIKKIKE